jgi:hypothetical protein
LHFAHRSLRGAARLQQQSEHDQNGKAFRNIQPPLKFVHFSPQGLYGALDMDAVYMVIQQNACMDLIMTNFFFAD